jgi:ubiquinone/menaquinone biosynthesis C-methylase UbiE
MNRQKQQTGRSFKVMSLMFKMRDIIRPRKNVLKDAGIQPGFRVLDFGCGPGGYLLPLARLIGKSGRIYALDLNPQAIRAVEAIAAGKNLNNIETITSDGATGLPDGSLDIVLLYDVFHHLKNPDDILKELHRVLKPEGFLSMNDHHLQEAEIIAGITGSGYFKLSRKGKKVYNFSKV